MDRLSQGIQKGLAQRNFGKQNLSWKAGNRQPASNNLHRVGPGARG